MFKLKKPLDWCILNQPFGVNYVDFYKKLGLKGHNGIDLKCYHNTLYATHDGIIKYAGKYSDGGIGIVIISDYNEKGKHFKTINYHLKSVGKGIKKGQHVLGGQPIGITDNTGKYSTGNHLHFGLKRCNKSGNTLDYNNGYHGAIDPTPYLVEDFYKLPVNLRYGKPRNWWAEWRLRFKNAWVHRQLMKRRRNPLSLTSEEVNAIIYGAWDFSIAINPAMKALFAFLTKSQYEKGQKVPNGFNLGI